MSKMKAKWINLDPNTLSANGDDVTVSLGSSLSATGSGIEISSVSGSLINASSIPDTAFTNALVKGDGTFTDGTSAFTGDLDLNNNNIVNLASPVDAQDAVNKAYVDSIATGITWKAPVKVLEFIGERSLGGIDALTPDIGTSVVMTTSSGVPAAGSSDTLAEGDLAEFDGTSWKLVYANTADRITNDLRVVVSTTQTLFSPLTDGVDDGKVLVSVAATGEITGTVSDFDDTGEALDGYALLVQCPLGNSVPSVNENNGYVFDGSVPTGSWIQFSGAGQITAGAGLTKVGNDLSVNVDDSSIEIDADTLRVKADGVTNAMLVNDSITLSGGNGLTGGGVTALGTTGTLDVDPTQLVSGGDAQIAGDSLSVDFVPTTYTTPSPDFTLSGQLNAIDTFLGTVGTGDGNVSAVSNFTDNVLLKGTGGTKTLEETTITIDDSNNLTTTASIYVSGDVVAEGQAYSVEYDGGTVAGTGGGAIAIDWDNGNVQHFTVSGATEFTESNANAGATYILIVEEDGTGGHALSAPAGFTWPGGAAPDYSTGAGEVNVIATVYSGVDSTHYADIRNDEPLDAQDLANLPTEITEGLTVATAGTGEVSAVLGQTPISTSNVKLWPDGGPLQNNTELGGGDFTVVGTTVTCQTSAGFTNGDDVYVTYEYLA
jgi:hypothetical protein